MQAGSYLKGQYLLASGATSLGGEPSSLLGKRMDWNGYGIFAEDSLPFATARSGAASIAVLGSIVHHEQPGLTDEQVLSWLLQRGKDVDSILALLQECGGRYVALIKDSRKIVAVPDACAMRQLFWFRDPRGFLLSSSARLILDALGERPEIDGKTRALFSDSEFIARQQAWYGDTWYDARINKVLANHYLDLGSATSRRAANQYSGPTLYQDILDYAAGILTGLLAAIHLRYPVMQALTAGYDSRLLLAASRSCSDGTRYYLFGNNYDLKSSADIRIAAQLCSSLRLPLQIIIPGALREDFLAEYRKKCFFPRLINGTAHIQWHYDNSRSARVINVNGNGGEIARFFFQNKARGRDVEESLIGIGGCGGFFGPQIRNWYADAIEYSKASGINAYDLFYWEQRMSNWGAMYRFEQDIAIDEFTPYNHKNLLLALLQVDVKKRQAPGYELFRDLMKQLWPETLSLPFNPIVGMQIKSRLKRVVKRIAHMK